MNNEEEREQAELCKWLDLKRIKYFAIPNGGARSPQTGAMLKRTGVKAGVPDLFICEPRGDYHGCFIEMKKRFGGVTSKEQREWLRALNMTGYQAIVCHGWTAAVEEIEKYLANGDGYEVDDE